MSAALRYSRLVLDLFKNPQNIGRIEVSSITDEFGIGIGRVGSASCGDMMELHIKVDLSTSIIVDAKFTAFGCPTAVASASLITQKIINITIADALKLKDDDIATELDLPRIKKHCSVLAEGSVRAAIDDYITRNNTTGVEVCYQNGMRKNTNSPSDPSSLCIKYKTLKIKTKTKNETNISDVIKSSFVLNITTVAARYITSIIDTANLNNKIADKVIGIKINVNNGGCSGLMYVFEYVWDSTSINDDEVMTLNNGYVIVVAQKAILHLVGATLDFTHENNMPTLIFVSNIKANCECGKSFAPQLDDLYVED